MDKEMDIFSGLDRGEVNDKWLIPESKLDDVQREILYGPYTELVVQGAAGSGKTVLGLYKLATIIKENLGTYAFVVFTITLKDFIKEGIKELERDLSYDIINDMKVYNADKFEKLLETDSFNKVDYLIIDEGQDLSKEYYEKIKSVYNKEVLILGDDCQQIFKFRLKNPLTMQEISEKMEIKEIKTLNSNYRVPKGIAKFAGSIIKDDGELERKCENEKNIEPHFEACNSTEQEIMKIIEIIDSLVIEDIAILVKKNEEVKEVKRIFEKNNKEIEYKYYENKDNDTDREYISNIRFSSKIIKVMTYHSAKGVEFDHIFLPFLSSQKDGYITKEELFVASTRCKKSLTVLFTGKVIEIIKKVRKV